MIIDRFGDTYAGAYTFSQAATGDEWEFTRPPVITQVGQMAGALDFYAGAKYPLGPFMARKTMLLTGTSGSSLEAAIDDLTNATIMVGESKLWGKQRDGTTHVWTYAKCTNLTTAEKSNNSHSIPVNIEFFCRAGEWYPEGEEATTYIAPFEVALLDGNSASIVGGATNNIISISIEERLDESGKVSYTVPATDYATASFLGTAARFKISHSGSTLAYGIIDTDTIDATATPPTRTVTGADMLRELQHYTMGWWCFYDGQAVTSTVLPEILAHAGWTNTPDEIIGLNIYYRFDGDSILAALIKIAEATGKHFRLTSTLKELEFGAFGESSSVTFTNVASALKTYDGTPIVGSLQITSDRGPVVNRIYPWGAGQDEGNLNRAKVSLFHLAAADTRWANIKAEPGLRGVQATVTSVEDYNESDAPKRYNVDSTTGFLTWPITQLMWCDDPADLTGGKGYDFVVAEIVSATQVRVRGSPERPVGPTSFPCYLISNPQLYIEDAAAYASDPHEAVIVFDDVTLTDLSLSSFATAAAQLYDRAYQYLQAHKTPQVSYAVSVYNCPNTLHVGDMVHLTYSGSVTRGGVSVDWVDVDADLNVISITRTYNADGSTSATIGVSNVAKQPIDTSGALANTKASLGYHATTVGALMTGAAAGPAGGSTPGSDNQPGSTTIDYLYLYLADDETAVISSEVGVGIIFVLCEEDASAAVFSLTGVNHVAYEMLDPQEQYTATAGTDGYTNVYNENGSVYDYYIENKRGAARGYYIYLHKNKAS